MLSHHSLRRQFDQPGLRPVDASATNATVSANSQLSHHSLHSFSPHGLSLQHQTTQRQPGPMPEAMPSRPLYRGHSSSSTLPTSHSYRENLLRRKTPQGTLAAAYDATPVEWTARPTKQILLPVLPSNGQHIQLDQGPRWQNVGTQGNQSWEGTLALRGADINLGSGCVNPTMWAANSNNQISANDGLNPYVRDFLLQQDQMVLPAVDNVYTGASPYGFQPLYNPITAPTASCENVDGFMNSGHYNGVPRDSNFYGHYGTWGDGNTTPSQLPQAVYQMNSLYNLPTQQLDNANIWQPQIPPGDSVSAPTFTQDIVPLYNLAPPPTGTPEAQFQHLQIDSPSHMIYQNRMISHSRDKSLAWAHGVYVELLASIQAQPNGRVQSGDRTRGHNGSTRPGLYPRPPIQPRMSGWKSNGFRPQPPVNEQHGGLSSDKDEKDRFKRTRLSPGREQHHSHIGTSSSHSQSLFCGNDGYLFCRNNGAAIYDGNDDVGSGSGNSESWNGGDRYLVKKRPVDCYSTSSLHHPPSGVENYGFFPTNIPYDGLGYMTNQQPSSPTQAAIVALEMLNGFCADSGWTWLDGMLLGGCLAYVRTHSLLFPA